MKNENSLKINIKQREETFRELLPKMAAVFAAAAGFSGMAFSAFGKIEPFFGIPVGLIAAACLLFSRKKFGKYIPFAVSAICLLAVLSVPVLRSGTLVLANEICEFLTAKTGEIYLPFEISGESFAAASLFLLALAVCAILSAVITLPMVIIAVFGTTSGFLSMDIYFMVFVAGFVVAVLLFFAPQSGTKNAAKSAATVLAAVFVCILVSAVLISFVTAEAGTEIKAFAEEALHSIIHDSETNAMPEGNFENLGAFDKNGAQALEIAMEKPQKLYLKGFTGEDYTGYGWKETDNSVLAEYAKEFYALHKNGFYGQSAIANALFAVGEQEISAMSIKNLSACSERAYLPYAVSSTAFNERKIGDANTESFGDEYETGYISGGLSEWYKAQVELSEKQGSDSAIDEHLANEYIYREFVKTNYLGVTEEAYNAIDRIFADSEAQTATEIISEILIYLEENVKYDENFASNGGTDFAAFFLEKSARGYSVHYATAATLMLRYFGIPARYAEGYFLSAEDAEKYESGEKIVLTEENAHAWAEYYLDGVGWVPFETTPGYMDDELEKAAFRTSGESSKRYEQSELPETNVEQDRPKDDITEAKKDYTALIAVLVSVPVVLLIVVFCYVLTMRKRLKKALSAMDNADNKTAVPLRFGYAEKLIEASGFDKETADYEEAFAINKEALFSEHEISDEQRRTVDDFAKKVLAKCKEKWSLWQKIKYKFIKFIY